MGTLRTVVAWLGASTLGLVSGLPHVTLADDAGPGKEVRAIRHDLPLILKGQLQQPYSTDANVQIEDVVVSGSSALVQWRSASAERVGYLTRRYKTWWLSNELYIGDAGAFTLNEHSSYGPTNWFLARAFGAPVPLIDLAAESLAAVKTANARPTKCGARNAQLVEPCSIGEGIFPLLSTTLYPGRRAQPLIVGDGYQMRLVFASNDAHPDATLVNAASRAPTEAESWMTPGGNSYFFFSGTVESDAPIHVSAGTAIDVWFPFLLAPSLYYGLTIAHADKPVGPIDGTLSDNVVHFVLPALTLLPGATLMGEIEGDSFRHE